MNISVKNCRKFAKLLIFLYGLLTLQLPSRAAQMQIMQWESAVLKDNPLHDPALRSIAIFQPAQASSGKRLPVVYYLPGYGSSPDGFISESNVWIHFTQRLADEVTPLVLVVVDGRTRWGGSQYLNSTAQGNYEDYVCDEVVRVVEARFPIETNGVRRIIAGHSSGGFGALRLGIARKKFFDAVVALSPDSDFPVSHLCRVQMAGVSNAPTTEINQLASGELPQPKNGDLTYAVGLSAAYAPRGKLYPGQFDWIYDSNGVFREGIWQRWLNNDPLTIVRQEPQAFSSSQAVYLDGAAHDEFVANIGARKIYEALTRHSLHSAFYEPPGHHSDHLQDRLQRGLAWVFDKPLHDIQ